MAVAPAASTAMATSADRVGWIDTAKGIGILLVVYGHVLRGLLWAKLPLSMGFFLLNDAWLYSFHMPLFFFLSGVLVDQSLARGWRRYVKRKITTILYPYVLWSLIYVGVRLLASGMTNWGRSLPDVGRIFLYPMDHFWFLYVLFFVFLSYPLLRRVHGMAPVIVGVGFYLLDTVVHWGVWNKYLESFVFFALGSWFFSQPWVQTGIQARTAVWGWAGTFFLLSGLLIVLGLPVPLVLEPLLAVTGLMSVVMLAQALTQSPWQRLNAGLAYLGRQAFVIYILHVMFAAGIRIVLTQGLHVEAVPIHLAAGMVFGVLGPVAVVWMLGRTKASAWLPVLGLGTGHPAIRESLAERR